MKTQIILDINPERMMKNDELLALRGGNPNICSQYPSGSQFPCFCTYNNVTTFAGCLADSAACDVKCNGE
jgi:hypothetical protein